MSNDKVLSAEQLDHFPWDGFAEYIRLHPDLLPDFGVPAAAIVSSFEVGLDQFGKAAILAWGPSNMGKSYGILPSITELLSQLDYATVSTFNPDTVDYLKQTDKLSQATNGQVLLLDEFCNTELNFKPRGLTNEEYIADLAQELADSVGLLDAVGIICVDAKNHYGKPMAGSRDLADELAEPLITRAT